MGGHSHWAGIKHKKALVDAKRGKVFTRLIREITIAARLGGGSPDGNPRLRKAIDDGKAANMPTENVKRAIQRGTGELPGVTYEELVYEGYGPGGIAVLCEATTDNKNRTTSEIRRLFSQHGGNLGESGCVAWMFQSRGYLTVRKDKADEELLMNLVLEFGAEDLRTQEPEVYEIITSPQDFEKVRSGLAQRRIPVESSELTFLPQSEVQVGEKEAPRVLVLMDALEEHEDVKNVYSNFNIPDEILRRSP